MDSVICPLNKCVQVARDSSNYTQENYVEFNQWNVWNRFLLRIQIDPSDGIREQTHHTDYEYILLSCYWLLNLPYANWGADFNTCTLQDGLTYNTSRNFAGYVEIFPAKIIEKCKISARKMAACIICWLSRMFCSPKKKTNEPRISLIKIPWINQCGLFISPLSVRLFSPVLQSSNATHFARSVALMKKMA